MWRASLIAYEKFKAYNNRNDKHYRATFFNVQTKERHTSIVKHRTAEDAVRYAKKFNERCARELARPFSDHMNAARHGIRWNWSTLLHLLRLHGSKRLIWKGIIFLLEVLLLDISHYQGDTDLAKMKANPRNVRGLIIKASQGVIEDLQFRNNWIKAKEQQIPRGAYHFFDSRVEPKQQAQKFWSLLKTDPPELMPVVDYEEIYNGPYAGPKNLRIFLEEFMRLSGYGPDRIIIYTGYYYWLAHSPTNTTELNWFAQFWLWLAWYTSNPDNIRIPAPWIQEKLILWQFDTPVWGTEMGMKSLEVDADWFIGSLQDYIRIFRLDPIPPPIGDTMKYGTVLVDALNIRTGPNLSYTDIGDLISGDKVVSDTQNGNWWHMTNATRNGVPVVTTGGQTVAQRNDTWSLAISSLGNVYIREDAPPPPAADIDEAVKTMSKHVIEVVETDAQRHTFEGELTYKSSEPK